MVWVSCPFAFLKSSKENMLLLSMLKTMVYVRCHYRRLRLPTTKRAHLPILMKYYTSNQRYHRQSCSTCPIWNKVQPVKCLQIKSHHYHYHNYYQNQTSTADRKSPPEEIEKALLTSHLPQERCLLKHFAETYWLMQSKNWSKNVVLWKRNLQICFHAFCHLGEIGWVRSIMVANSHDTLPQ